MQPRIFELFTQVDESVGRSQGGLGIGLSLVKNFVELHGGSVQVRSEGPGKGSEFTVRLPLADARGSDRLSNSACPERLRGMTNRHWKRPSLARGCLYAVALIMPGSFAVLLVVFLVRCLGRSIRTT